jgi:drug/metabolite transporter (DMT)-like permease
MSRGAGGASPALVVAAAAATGILVGSSIVATRFVIAQTHPASLALLRYVVGLACLLPAVALAPRVRFARRDLLPIALLGITQFGILIALLNFGLERISSSLGALIFASFPLLTMVLAAALGAERLTVPRSLGVSLTILGVGLALAERLTLPGWGLAQSVGALAVLASAFSGAACSVLYRPYLARYPALPVSALAMAASVLALAGMAAGEGFFDSVPDFTAGGWLAIAYIGVSSGAGYYLWLWALQHTTPTRVTVFLALSPITATLLGALLLGEAVSVPFLVGLACVAGGLWLAHRERVPAP